MNYTFFYGESGDYAEFSQWYACGFKVDEVPYNCAEQFMMHQKALMFGDEDAAKCIMEANHPREQKALGRLVKGFRQTDWNTVARDIVYRGNYAKFSQNKKLKALILSTGDSMLVEASRSDKIWGIGLGLKDERRLDPQYWRGTNWLGEVLTKVRDDIRAGVHRTENFGWKKGT